MKMPVWLAGVLALCLTACAMQPVRVDARATDLEVLRLGVHAMTEPREVAGTVQHPDQARTNAELMGVALDLDDVAWLSEGDKARVRTFVDQAVVAMAAARQQACSWINLRCKARNRRALAPLAAPAGSPSRAQQPAQPP